MKLKIYLLIGVEHKGNVVGFQIGSCGFGGDKSVCREMFLTRYQLGDGMYEQLYAAQGLAICGCVSTDSVTSCG